MRACSLCCEKIEHGYARAIQTLLLYCDVRGFA
jgi:hypothetical protein